MKRLWFITNPGSGSADTSKAGAIEAACRGHGWDLVGRTDFPADTLPLPDQLDAATVDTAVLFAGDGTINAAVCALADWGGAILILPGGTMNMLAKMLHGDADPAKILVRAAEQERRIALPYVEAGEHRALVGLIVGPAASWFRPREVLRRGELGSLWPAMRAAWRRTFGRGIRLSGAPGLPPYVQGAYIRADKDRLAVVAVNARDFRSIADLGWSWIRGDWASADAVAEIHAEEVRIAERRPVLSLFDGEPASLDPGTRISAGRTGKRFITTLDEVK